MSSRLTSLVQSILRRADEPLTAVAIPPEAMEVVDHLTGLFGGPDATTFTSDATVESLEALDAAARRLHEVTSRRLRDARVIRGGRRGRRQ